MLNENQNSFKLFRIITTEVVRNIGALFKQEIKGAWITFDKYPHDELKTLFDRFKGSKFTYTCSEERLFDLFRNVIAQNYSDWMYRLRQKVFGKFTSPGERYANRPSNVPDPAVWNTMVDEWLKPEFVVRIYLRKISIIHFV